MDEADRLSIGVLVHALRELITIVGKLNALTGAMNEEFLAEHTQIMEELLDTLATATRVADRFAPPAPPE